MCDSKKTQLHSKQINSIRLATTFVSAFTENIIQHFIGGNFYKKIKRSIYRISREILVFLTINEFKY